MKEEDAGDHGDKGKMNYSRENQLGECGAVWLDGREIGVKGKSRVFAQWFPYYGPNFDESAWVISFMEHSCMGSSFPVLLRVTKLSDT